MLKVFLCFAQLLTSASSWSSISGLSSKRLTSTLNDIIDNIIYYFSIKYVVNNNVIFRVITSKVKKNIIIELETLASAEARVATFLPIDCQICNILV
jgi:hypothetical protein